jgi:hypothetical protein
LRYSGTPKNDSDTGAPTKGMAMTDEKNDRRSQEREEIAARIASFRATQQKFEREREEYFVTTMENARKGDRPSFWP